MTRHQKQQPKTSLQQFIDATPERWQQCVCWALMTDRDAWERFSPVVGVDTSTGTLTPDFDISVYNLVLEALRRFRAMAPPGTFVVPTGHVMAVVLESMKSGAYQYTSIEFEYAEKASRWLLENGNDFRPLLPVLEEGLAYWLPRQKIRHAAARSTSKASPQAFQELMASLQASESAVQTALRGDYQFTDIADSLSMVRPGSRDVVRTGLDDLDLKLGGGLARGEGALVLAPPGVGKTMLATHLAAEIPLGHPERVSLLFSTEEGAERLWCRIFSSRGDIPYDALKDGFDPESLPQNYMRPIQDLIRRLRGRVHVDHWTGADGKTVNNGSVERAVEAAIRKFGRVDLVQFDWLGAALTKEYQYDKDKKRMALQEAADKMADIAKIYHVAAVAYGQLHKKEAVDTLKVGIAMAVDNKTLDQKMATVIALTALTPFFGMNDRERRMKVQEEALTGASEGRYKDEQFFVLEKTRFGPGGLAPFRRDGAYQRISSIASGKSRFGR